MGLHSWISDYIANIFLYHGKEAQIYINIYIKSVTVVEPQWKESYDEIHRMEQEKKNYRWVEKDKNPN